MRTVNQTNRQWEQTESDRVRQTDNESRQSPTDRQSEQTESDRHTMRADRVRQTGNENIESLSDRQWEQTESDRQAMKTESLTDRQRKHYTFHVIGDCLPSQPASEKHNQDNKKPTNPNAPHAFLKQMCRPCLRKKQFFAYCRCVICFSYSVLLISTYYVHKGSWAFLS